MRRLILSAVALLTVGCQTSPENSATIRALVPPDYRAQVERFLHDKLRDPYSVRDAEISKPAAIYVGFGAGVNGAFGPGVCVRFNAKNGFGGYVGKQTQAVWFSQTGVILVPAFNSCKNVEWVPFTEFEGH